jgi:ATP-dependent RNA helicase RhlE
LTDFSTLGLSPAILKSVTELGFTQPTPIQVQAIPHLLEDRDLVGLAQTGTGKTAAFGLPLIQKLSGYGARPGPRATHALILAPTRELVNQIATNLRGFVRHSHLKVTAVVGGQSINVQINALQRGTDILVATPGRLLDLVERKAVRLDTAKVLILDEADQMLDLGFIHALRRIAKMVGTPRQTMLFSATMPNQIEELSRAYLVDPVRVEVSPPGRTADRIAQSVHFVDQRAKTGLLTSLLKQRPGDLSLVFARTKHGAEKLMKNLVKDGLSAASIHGNKSQGQRERAIKAFRDGEIRVLVATDVAARGIDIPGVSHVYNFDLPEVAESYVHRIGRTARAGADGKAVAFCSAAEMHLLKGIEKLTGVALEVAGGTAPTRQAAAQAADEASKERRDAQRQRPGNGPRMKSGHQKPGQKTAEARSGQRQGDQQRPAGNKRRRPRRQRAAA